MSTNHIALGAIGGRGCGKDDAAERAATCLDAPTLELARWCWTKQVGR